MSSRELCVELTVQHIVCFILGLLACTLRTSSEFWDVSSSIRLRSSVTVSGSAGRAGSASSSASEALERLERSFSEREVQDNTAKKNKIKRTDITSVQSMRASSVLKNMCRLHTGEVKHFIHVLRVTCSNHMPPLQLLQQPVPL